MSGEIPELKGRTILCHIFGQDEDAHIKILQVIR